MDAYLNGTTEYNLDVVKFDIPSDWKSGESFTDWGDSIIIWLPNDKKKGEESTRIIITIDEYDWMEHGIYDNETVAYGETQRQSKQEDLDFAVWDEQTLNGENYIMSIDTTHMGNDAVEWQCTFESILIPLHGSHFFQICKEAPYGIYDRYDDDYEHIIQSIEFTDTIE